MAKYKNKAKGMLGSVRGVCSYDKNPYPEATMNKTRVGPGSNPDQVKAEKLLKKQLKGREMIRGKGYK